MGKQRREFAEAAHPSDPHIHSGGVTTGYDERCNARGAGLLSQEKAAPPAPLKQFSHRSESTAGHYAKPHLADQRQLPAGW